MAADTIPGWYGKLPTLGDFASRRIDADWIGAWDAWLADGLAALREASEDGWLEGYLASPSWHFVLMPGALPGPSLHGASAGVLMASVDRAGRYFPLTLVAPLAALPASCGDVELLLAWLHRLDDLGADALHDDWSIDRLESELQALRGPFDDTLDEDGADPLAVALRDWRDDGVVTVPDANAELAAAFAALAAAQAAAAFDGVSFWLAATEQPRRLLVCRGLPARDRFGALFGADRVAAP